MSEGTVGLVTEEGGGGTPVTVEGSDWRQALSADLRGDSHIQAYDDLEKFAKTAVSAQHMLGKKGVIPPGDNASVEDFAKYYEQLGRPTNVDRYVQKDVEGVEWTEGVQRDESFENEMLKEMYDSGLTPYQAKRIFDQYAVATNGRHEQAVEEHETNQQSLDEQLSKEFGYAKDSRLEAANKAWVKILGDQEKATEMANMRLPDGTLLGQNFALIKGMAELGQHIDGATGLIGDKQPSFTKSPQEAKVELNTLMGDEQFMEAWTTPRHPGHAAAQQRFVEASAAARGEG